MRSAISSFIKTNRVLLILFAVTTLVYARFLFYGHISWDDPEMVFKNKAVKSFDITQVFSQAFVGNYIPVTMMLHGLAYQVFGSWDAGHHLLSILLHLLNGFLIYQLSIRLFKKEAVGLCAAAVFLLHPLQVESVGWISELKNVLSTTFYLLSFIAYLKWKQGKNFNSYLIALLYFVVACLCKPSAVVIPLVLIGADVLLFKEHLSRVWLNKIPFLLLSIIFGLVNLKTQEAAFFINRAHEFPYYQRFGLSGYALLQYALLFLLPVNLSVIYPYPSLNTINLIMGCAVWLIIIAAVVYIFKKQKKLLFIPAFILINFILVLQFIPFGEVLYADRYAYIPLIAFGWLVGLGLEKILPGKTGLVMIVASIMGLATFLRGDAWKSALSLYEDILKKHPASFVALNSAGVECMLNNLDEKAGHYFEAAIVAAPGNYKGFYNRGLLFLKINKPEQAIQSFNQAIALYDYHKSYVGRASAYLMLGDLPKAMSDARLVLNKDPLNPKAHLILGNCNNELNRLDEALEHYNTCIAIDDEEAAYYFKRGIVQGKKQNFEKCLEDLDYCLMLNPDFTEAYYWRGVAKTNLKQEACADFREAARKNFKPAVNAFNKYCR